MDLGEFLARTTAPGNFFAVCYNRTPGQKGGFSTRMFPGGAYAEAAGFIGWCVNKNWDTYHAQASFKAAIPDAQTDGRGRQKFRGERSQANAQKLRSFWVDIDVARPGDKKPASQTFPDQASALRWLAGFLKATSLPKPNQVVSSGYGLHVYWILEEAIGAQDWQPYAEALKHLLIANNFPGDAGLSADAARLLRPPGTFNFKDQENPAKVELIDRLTSGEIPNANMLAVLQPHVVAVAAATGTNGTSPLAGGGGQVAQIFGSAPNLNAAAQANLPAQAKPREFSRIATQCVQVKTSLANHGNGDPYPLWYLGHLTLSHFCVDGLDYVHTISDGDPRYKPADTDAAVARIAREHARKNNGPPSCGHFERARPGVCATCPHFGKIHSPWDLGAEDGDLPDGYRRSATGIEERHTSSKGNVYWDLLTPGDVQSPVLDELPQGGLSLSFTYLRGRKSFPVQAIAALLPHDSGTINKLFEPQGINLPHGHELRWRAFLVAWINKLRDQCAERSEQIHPFGWARGPDGHAGFALAGTLYRPDGSVEAAPGGDREALALYKTNGTLAKWKQATEFVIKNRPDLMVLVACSFGAPLMRLTGHAGLAVSAWSPQSAVGKTSSMICGQAIWGAPGAKNSLDDTGNSIWRKAAIVRALPIWWDEMRIGSDETRRFTNMIFALSQGKEKARLTSDAVLRPVGEWETILVCASNRPLIDFVMSETEGTEAGALRIFEYMIEHPSQKQSAAAAAIIAMAKENYGHAGREYAAFLATHYDKVKDAVLHTMDNLTDRVQADQSERFYIAGMACILVGAMIANRLKLTSFDINAMTDFLCAVFRKLRAARRSAVVASAKGYDLQQILADFMITHQGGKLVTNRFQNQSRRKVTVKWNPLDKSAVNIHVSQEDKTLRINRVAFYAWARKKGLPAQDVVEAMQKQWGAVVEKRIIGGGTGFGGGQLWCVDIPLTDPALEGYLCVDDEEKQ